MIEPPSRPDANSPASEGTEIASPPVEAAEARANAIRFDAAKALGRMAEAPPVAADEEKGHASGQTTPYHPIRPKACITSALWVLFFLALTAAMDCANFRNVFVTSPDGKQREVYFVDGDCYARMTRVREILEHGGPVHFHAWENFPYGTWPHTTAPMDYLIVWLSLALKPFIHDSIDIAGAIISPILGVLMTAFLAFWARELNQQYRRLMLLLASVSPILVHGMELGRPDHQSLQMLLMAIGIGSELIMARVPTVGWGIASGIAWGLGLWVSLYEPLVLMVLIFVTKFVFYRPKLFVKERVWGIIIFLGILTTAWLLEGQYLVRSFSMEAHDHTMRDYFTNWTATIGEMSRTSVFSGLLCRWVGFGLLAAPLLLIARLRDTKRSTLLLSMLVVTFFFTLQEVRWGYFFVLIYVMSLPWQLSLFRRKWLVYSVFLLSLWPVAQEWDERFFPDEAHDVSRMAQMNDKRRLRQAAEWIGQHASGGILAPWWWSPQLVYWSGQPALAGSSHESLSGIVATSQFFSTTNPKEAQAICDSRKVETVVTGNPENIVIESAHVLGQPLPEKDNTMADILWEKPHSCPIFLHEVFGNGGVIRIFEVNHGYIVR